MSDAQEDVMHAPGWWTALRCVDSGECVVFVIASDAAGLREAKDALGEHYEWEPVKPWQPPSMGRAFSVPRRRMVALIDPPMGDVWRIGTFFDAPVKDIRYGIGFDPKTRTFGVNVRLPNGGHAFFGEPLGFGWSIYPPVPEVDGE